LKLHLIIKHEGKGNLLFSNEQQSAAEKNIRSGSYPSAFSTPLYKNGYFLHIHTLNTPFSIKKSDFLKEKRHKEWDFRTKHLPLQTKFF